MPTFQRPGVYVTETLVGPQPAPLVVSPSTAGFIGEHWRGPVGVAKLCNSWSDFVTFYGGFNTSATPVLANPYLAYEVYEYFSNGGQACWVNRVGNASTPGATATALLVDQAATPQNTILLTAGALGVSGSPGTWGNNLYVTITQQPTAGRFNLSILYGGTAASNVVETWSDLSMNVADSRYFVTVINSTVQGSLWVVATNQNSQTASPLNAPATITAQQFGTHGGTAGVDPADPASADYINQVTYGNTAPAVVAAFDLVPGILNFNIPGVTASTIIDAAITYAQNRPYTFLVMDPPAQQTPAGAQTYLASLSPTSAFAALYYPWLTATNPASTNLLSTISLPPGGFVLGQMVNVDKTQGVWVAPAGDQTNFANVVSAERPLSAADLNLLNSNNVNALRTRGNGQVVIWGTRTMSSAYATLYVPIRRMLNYLEASLVGLLDFAVFAPNDQILWTQITTTLNNFLGGLFGQNAFPGSQTSQAFYVICNSTNNTPTSIAAGVVNTTVGVALLYPAEFINLTVAQFQSSGATSVTTSFTVT